jgi:ankyrin repeat protein
MQKSAMLAALLAIAAWAQQPDIYQAITSKNLAGVRQAVAKNPAIVVQVDSFHGSPLNTAVRYGSTEIVRYLLERGARVNQRESINFTALEAAAAANKPEAARLLIQYHAPLEARDDMGRTPLMMAVETGTVPVARILIDAGADLTTVNRDKRNLLAESLRQGRPEMVEYLLRRGAPSKGVDFNYRHPRGPNSAEAKEIDAILRRHHLK